MQPNDFENDERIREIIVRLNWFLEVAQRAGCFMTIYLTSVELRLA